MVIENIGATAFGLVVGWITYRTLRRKEGPAALSDIAAIIGAVGGGAITALFGTEELFGYYAIGLAAGFFGYLIVALMLRGKSGNADEQEQGAVDDWMGH